MVEVGFIEPMLALSVERLPSGPDWEYELKLDGYRALAVKHVGAVPLYLRNHISYNSRNPGLVKALAAMPDETILDGEIVALDDAGRPSFHKLRLCQSQITA